MPEGVGLGVRLYTCLGNTGLKTLCVLSTVHDNTVRERKRIRIIPSETHYIKSLFKQLLCLVPYYKSVSRKPNDLISTGLRMTKDQEKIYRNSFVLLFLILCCCTMLH